MQNMNAIVEKIKPIVIDKARTIKKTRWQKFSPTDMRLGFKPISLKNKKYGKVCVSIKNFDDARDTCLIKLETPKQESLGQEIISLFKDKTSIYGYSIEINQKWRSTLKKSVNRFGEILRLISVMTMNKNQCKSMQIYSKADTVYFHSKYKFEPNIEDISEIKSVLETIMQDKTKGYEIFVRKAKNIYSQLFKMIHCDKTGNNSINTSIDKIKVLFNLVKSIFNTSIIKSIICGKK